MLRLPGAAPSQLNTTGDAFASLARPRTGAAMGAMKIARTILRNLFTKGVEDEKYRTLSLTNPKVAEKLLSQPSVVGFLLNVGFENTGEALTFRGDVGSQVARLSQEYDGLSALLSAAVQENASGNANTAGAPAKRKMPSVFADAGKKSIKAQMREKEEAKRKAKSAAERKRRKELLKGFDNDKEARKQPGWEAKLSGANRGAAPSAQASEGANLQAH